MIFNGIRVGEVTESALPEDPRRVVAVDRGRPHDADPHRHAGEARAPGPHRGRARSASSAASPAPPLRRRPGQPLPTIFADRSDFQDLMESGAHHRAPGRRRARAGRHGRLRQRRPDQPHPPQCRALLAGAEQECARHRPIPRAGRAGGRARRAARGKARDATDDVQKLVRAVEPQRVARIVENVEGFTRDAWREPRGRLEHAARRGDASPAVSTRRAEARSRHRRPRQCRKGDRSGKGRPHGRQCRGAGATPSTRSAWGASSRTRTTSPRRWGKNREVINNALRDAASLIASLNATAPKLDSAVAEIDATRQGHRPDQGRRTVDNLDTFSQI